VKPRLAVFALAAVLAATIAYDLWRTPVQVWDAIEELMDAQRSPSVAASFEAAVGTTAYLRPLRIAQIKALFDLSGGHYQVAYRGFHAALLVALLLLFARALRVESWRDAAAAAFALTVLTGTHTFLGFLREAFPINHFLEIAVLTLAALNLSISRGGWWADLLAALVFVVAALTLESGILVWVVLAAAWICGLRGVSTRGVAAVTVLLAGYFALRFWYLRTGLPELDERTSGYLLERLGPRDVEARFGAQPWLFYAYNVAASALSVLASEPRDGQFVAVRAWLQRDVHPAAWLALATSIGTTGLALWWGAVALRRRVFTHAERLAVVAVAVLAANVALSFAYAKDDIVAVAGVFYALAAFAAVRGALTAMPAARPAVALAACAIVGTLACGWAVRSSGVHYVVGSHAFRIRNDWARAPLALEQQGRWPPAGPSRALIDTLRRDALAADVPNPLLEPDWKERWYGN
jgi:hypothetical protein